MSAAATALFTSSRNLLRSRSRRNAGRTGAQRHGQDHALRTLVGLADRFGGDVRIDGQAMPPRDPRAFARLGITFVPDDRGVFPRLTVGENIELARLCAYAATRLDVYELFPALQEHIGQPAGTLSGGQLQQVAIARALATGPRLLIIDELSQGLQPSIVQDLTAALTAATRGSGLTLDPGRSESRACHAHLREGDGHATRRDCCRRRIGCTRCRRTLSRFADRLDIDLGMWAPRRSFAMNARALSSGFTSAQDASSASSVAPEIFAHSASAASRSANWPSMALRLRAMAT